MMSLTDLLLSFSFGLVAVTNSACDEHEECDEIVADDKGLTNKIGTEEEGQADTDAADDVPGCEVAMAFVANWGAFDGTPAWWAFDFSNCGPNPEPRLMVWESGDGYVCEQWIDPVGDECEIVVMGDCEKFADDMWHAVLWTAGADAWSLGYEAIAGPDYSPDSTLVCGAEIIGGETFWNCTGLPVQRPTCTPIVAD